VWSQVASTTGWVPGEPVPGEVVVYFADDPRRLYQLRQWLPVFELLDRAHPVLVVTRHPQTYAEVGRLTRLPRVCVPKLAELVQLYGDGAPRVRRRPGPPQRTGVPRLVPAPGVRPGAAGHRGRRPLRQRRPRSAGLPLTEPRTALTGPGYELSQRLVDRAKADAWSRCAGRVAASTTRCRLDVNAELAARLRAAARAGHLVLNKSHRVQPIVSDSPQVER
jgi:hypothetical protein